MSEAKSALIIANCRYEHQDLRQLAAPEQDAESLTRVLGDPAIGGFQVRTLINEPSHKLNLEIESFFDDRKCDDLLLLYFSGHGIKDADGQLYFATIDTQLIQHNVRRATAVAAHFVNEVMSRSRSRRQILLLDCCYSGAFKEGMLAKSDKRVGSGEQLGGQGRVVLTASDALQYSFEGGKVQGEAVRSIFTRTLVRGLESGEADLDRDGLFSLDEVYEYIYDQVANEMPEQKPTKMGYVAGKIFIGNNPRPVAGDLPAELRKSLEDSRPWVRLGAVHQLEKLLGTSNKGLTLAARAALESLVQGDDSLQVIFAATKVLADFVGLQNPEGKQAAPEEIADRTDTRLSPADIQRASESIARYLGPISGILAKRAAQRSDNLRCLYMILAGYLKEGPERTKFLNEAGFPES
jgi:Caspase domain